MQLMASGTTGDVGADDDATEYTISFGELVTGTQAGGFGWVAANNEVTIYVDSIAYVDDLEVTEPDAGTDAGTDGGSGGEFTVSISDNFGPSGYFGEFCAITELTCPDGPQGGAGACIGYEWVPNGGPCELRRGRLRGRLVAEPGRQLGRSAWLRHPGRRHGRAVLRVGRGRRRGRRVLLRLRDGPGHRHHGPGHADHVAHALRDRLRRPRLR